LIDDHGATTISNEAKPEVWVIFMVVVVLWSDENGGKITLF
jgi:hypothetical protein